MPVSFDNDILRSKDGVVAPLRGEKRLEIQRIIQMKQQQMQNRFT